MYSNLRFNLTMNNDTIIIAAIIAAIPPTLTAYVAFKSIKKDVREVHLSLNSRLDQLLQSEKIISRAEGVREGKNEKN